jgi:hypothetical protein
MQSKKILISSIFEVKGESMLIVDECIEAMRQLAKELDEKQQSKEFGRAIIFKRKTRIKKCLGNK